MTALGGSFARGLQSVAERRMLAQPWRHVRTLWRPSMYRAFVFSIACSLSIASLAQSLPWTIARYAPVHWVGEYVRSKVGVVGAEVGSRAF